MPSKRIHEPDYYQKKYIEQKIRMLQEQFCLRLTELEKAHFRTLKTESEVDQYAHRLLRDKL